MGKLNELLNECYFLLFVFGDGVMLTSALLLGCWVKGRGWTEETWVPVLVLPHNARGRGCSLSHNIHCSFLHINGILSFQLGTWLPEIHLSASLAPRCGPVTKIWAVTRKPKGYLATSRNLKTVNIRLLALLLCPVFHSPACNMIAGTLAAQS